MAGQNRQSISTAPLQYNKDLDSLKAKNRFSLHWFDDELRAENDPDSFHMKEELPLLPEAPREIQPRWTTIAAERVQEGTFYGQGHEEVPTGPLEFVESHRFQTVVAVVIVANAIIIGLETDIQTPMWYWVEQGLLVFFVTELVLRVLHNGAKFFSGEGIAGNIVDVGIVMSGVIDMWLVPTAEAVLQFFTQSKQKHKRNIILQAMGILRMLRIIRLIRLVKIVKPLYTLALGVGEAMQGMFWVLVFLFMLLYAIAIICTRLIGHGAVLPDQDPDNVNEEVEEIRQMFHSVFGSMFVLFELMSCWSLIPLTPLFTRLPILKLLFVIFYIFSAWALLAVMTGVVSEKMIAVREQINIDEKDSNKKGAIDNEALMKQFRKVDVNNDGCITQEEFDTLMADAEAMRLLMTYANVNAQDLQDLFEWLDSDKDETISVKEFVEGFRWLNETVTPKSFVKLQEKLSSDLRLVEVRLVHFINERFDALIQSVKLPLRKINAVTTQVQRLDATCSEMSQLLRERGRVQLTRQGLAEAERRIGGRIDALLEAVETLAMLQKEGRVTLENKSAGPAVRSSTFFDGSRGFAL